MPYPSPADDKGNGGCLVAVAFLLLLVIAGIASAFVVVASAQPEGAETDELATVYDTPAEEPEVTVRPQSEGPIYDLPDGIEGSVVCDRQNRAYILLTTEEGGVAITPYLDEDGSQVVIPYG